MKFRVFLLLVFVIILFILIFGCTRQKESSSQQDDVLNVVVSIPPQAYLVQKIGGEHVNVDVLIKPGQSPHTFEPMPSQVIILGNADLYMRIGLPFEDRLIEKISADRSRLKIINMDEGIEKLSMAEHHHHAEEHQHEIDDASTDPHIWLSPPVLKIIARNVADALVESDGDNTNDYRKNLTDFSLAVDSTHKQIKSLLAPYRGRSFYVFHPAFGYFADAYGLRQEPVELEGKSPSPKQLQEFIERARAENISTIFVQPQFDAKNAEAVAKAIDGAVVPLDPLGENILGNLLDMANKIERAFGQSSNL